MLLRFSWLLLGPLTAPLMAAPPRCIEPQPAAGSSLAVVVEAVPLVHTRQTLADRAGSAKEEVDLVLVALDGRLKEAGASLSNAVKLNVYVRNSDITAVVEQRLAKTFAGAHKPAVSYVTTTLPMEGMHVAIDAVAVSSRADVQQVLRFPTAEKARQCTAAILPAGPQVYLSGQAEKGDGTLADATRQTMNSLFATLKWLEISPDDVVHVKAFLSPMSKSSEVIVEMASAFGDATPPPISLVEWESSLPIEIEMAAAGRVRTGAPRVEYLTPPGMTSSPVFARVVRTNSPQTIYLAGLFGATNEPSGEAEVRELFAHTERLTKAAGSDLKHLVKATYYVADNDVSAWHNQLRPMYYDPERPPAASKAMVRGVGRKGRTITWDMIAVPTE